MALECPDLLADRRLGNAQLEPPSAIAESNLAEFNFLATRDVPVSFGRG
jgi:hypothetical protein